MQKVVYSSASSVPNHERTLMAKKGVSTVASSIPSKTLSRSTAEYDQSGTHSPPHKFRSLRWVLYTTTTLHVLQVLCVFPLVFIIIRSDNFAFLGSVD